jgi:tetratricopeptide (TPR) repeat protein
MVCSWARRLGGVVVFAALAAPGLLLFAQAQMAAIEGTCTGEDGKPLIGYFIMLDRQETKWTGKVKTNKKGEYVYIGLIPGDYRITLTDPGGRNVFTMTRHLGIGEPTEVNFDMAKEMALAKKENPAYQQKVEEQAKEQKQYTGLKQLFEQGQALSAQNKYAEAAAAFEQALPLAKGKNTPVVLAQLANTYGKAASADTDRDAKVKDQEKALDYFQKAIEANPTDGSLHNNRGKLYAEMGKTAEAQAEFQKAAEIDPADAARYYYNLGVIMYNQGKMDEAAAALKKSTDLDNKFADAYYLEAQALLGKATVGADGKVVPAPGTVEALQSYLTLQPNGQWSQAARESLELLTGKLQTEYKAQKKKGS